MYAYYIVAARFSLACVQEQLEKKVAGSADLQNNRTDQLLQQHYNQMQHLNEQIQHYRETQKKQLNEKIEMKQRLKEKLS